LLSRIAKKISFLLVLMAAYDRELIAQQRLRRTQLVLDVAKSLSRQREADGLVGANSPTPVSFIYELLDDKTFLAWKRQYGPQLPQTMLDLGSGDGRWLLAFVDRFCSYACFGVEMDERQLANSLERIHSKKKTSPSTSSKRIIELIRSDFTHFSCHGYAVIVVYMSRLGNIALKDKLEQECENGTCILVIGFEMRGWRMVKMFRCTTLPSLVAYMYVVGQLVS
jgi:SAM-dependent methyltransferase